MRIEDLSMRIDNTTFSLANDFRSIQNEQLVYEMGLEIARQCQRLGFI